MGNYFVVSCGNYFVGENNSWNIKMGDACEILVNGISLCKGLVKDLQIMYSPQMCSLVLIGVDEVSDLIDCSFAQTVNEWKNQSIKSIIENLCSPFDIEVSVATDATSIVSRVLESFKADEGDTVSDIIIRLCRDYGILPISLGDGYLTITRATPTAVTVDTLQLGGNVTVGNYMLNDSDRFSNYIVKGIGQGSDTKTLTDFIEPYGRASDSVIQRYRPMVIFTDSPSDIGSCQIRAKWEANLRAGYSRKLFYTVPGLTQSDGSIWDINMLVPVQDAIMDINDTRLIDSVEYIQGEENIGEFVILGLVDRRTYSATGDASQIKGKFDV